MSRRSPARRLASVAGVLLLLGGIVAAAVLFVLGPRYRDRQVDDFARGVVGCVTPLVFTETGTYYVYQEVAGPELPVDACPATPRPGDFSVELRAPGGPAELVDDRTASYNTDGSIGTSIRRFDVTEVGVYELTVNGPDAATRAAVGPDPDGIVDDYRRWALIAGLGGVLAGLALLIASGLGGKRDRVAVADAPVVTPFEPPAPAPLAPAPPAAFAPPPSPAPAPATVSIEQPPAVEPGPGTAHDPWGAPSVDGRQG